LQPDAGAEAEPAGEFLAECFLPGVDDARVRDLDERAARGAAELTRAGARVRYLGSILMREDEVVLSIRAGSEAPCGELRSTFRRGAPVLQNQGSTREREASPMYARASEFHGPPEQLEEGVRYARASVVPAVSAIPGYRGTIGLVDWVNGKAWTLTLWDNEAAMRASEDEATNLRTNLAEQIGEGVAAVERFDVAYFDVR
jgi:hypothetical protein